MKRKTDKLLSILLAAMVATTAATSSVYAFTNTVPQSMVQTKEMTQSNSNPNDPNEEESTPSQGESSSSPSSSEPSQPDSSSSSEASEPESSSSSEPSKPTPPPSSSSNPAPSRPEASSSQPQPGSSSSSAVSSKVPSSSSSQAVIHSSSEPEDTSSRETSLLPGSSHTSQVNSYDWNELLSGIGSDGSTISFNSQEAAGTTKENDSGVSWLLIAGIALIVLALGGIGVVVYTQFIRGSKEQELPLEADLSQNPYTNVSGDTAPIDLGTDYGEDYEEYTDVSTEESNEIYSHSSDDSVPTSPQRTMAPGLDENFAADLFATDTVEPTVDTESETLDQAEATAQEEQTTESMQEEPESKESSSEELSEEIIPEIEKEQPVSSEQTESGRQEALNQEDASGEEMEEIFSSSESEQNHLAGNDPFDLQFNQPNNDTQSGSPVQNANDNDDFWDKFFRT